MLTLIDMNLLPGRGRRTARRRGRRKARVPRFEGLRELIRGDPLTIAAGVLGVLAVAHLGLTFFTQGAARHRIADALVEQREDSVRYAEAIALLDSLAARADTLQRRTAIIREIDADRFVWAHILNEVSESLPDHTWLTAIQESAARGGAIAFRIDGRTGQTAALTRFMRDLANSPFVDDVRLVSDEQVQQGARLVHSFVLVARYQISDSTVIVTEPIILARK
jgi:Tfp pilus assembly protein PilN